MANAKATFQAIFARTETLAQKYDSYTEQFVTRAHKELYALLSGIYQVCLDVQEDPNKEKLVKELRQRLKEQQGARTNSDAPVVSLVVRYITRASRKTRHTYSRVFEVAMKAGVKAADLPAFIEQHGGIDKVREATTVPVSGYTKDVEVKAHEAARMQLAYKLARERNVGTVKFANGVPAISNDVEFWHVLCRFDSVAKEFVIDFAAYPSKKVEQDVLHHYVIALQGACMANKHGFKEHCKQLGLHDDYVLRWMSCNGIKDADHAISLLALYKQEVLKTADALTAEKKEASSDGKSLPAPDGEVIEVECQVVAATQAA